MNSTPGTNAITGPIIALLDWQPLMEDHGIPLAIMGLSVVFAALVLVRIFIGLLPRIMAGLDWIYPEAGEKPQRAAPPITAAATPPDEIAVVIAAAVAIALHVPHRIVHIRALSPEDLNWPLEGRLQHHASHRIHPRNRR